MKKILILGAGIYQVPLIKKAKEMGLYTIVTSIPGNYPGFALADKVVYENTIDLEAVLRLAQQEQVDGVVTAGTDVCIPTLAYVCDQMGLKGLTLTAAEKAQSKLLMKQAFVEHGVNTAAFEYVDIHNANPVEVCQRIGYPVMFKSIDASGSRGITKASAPEDIPFAYKEVVENTHSKHYIIEKFLSGEEYGAQAFVYDGTIRFILPHGDYVFQGGTGVPLGHFAPYDMSEEIIEDSKLQLQRAVTALGVDNCAINADFMLVDGKAYVLEIGARAGATCLVEMTEQYYGIDYYRQIIRCAMGEEPDFTPGNAQRQPCVVMLFQSDKTGTIRAIDMGDQSAPGVLDVSLDYGVGDTVRKFRKGPDRIGQCIVIGPTVEAAKQTLDEAMAKVKITVE